MAIRPDDPQIETRESIQFTVEDTSGEEVLGHVDWGATGGTITQHGLYTAGAIPGTYWVTAKNRGRTATQRVTVESAQASSDPPDSEDPSDDPDDPPVSDYKTIFADGFESGDFRVWSGAATIGDSCWDGIGDGGAHRGDGCITSERVHSGRLAWKALIDPAIESAHLSSKSMLARWKSMGALEFYISAWYFIPTDHPAVNSQLMQIKAAGSGPSHAPVGFRIDSRDKELFIRSGILNTVLYRTGVKAPVGRWFNLTGRFVIADSGLVEMWLDGQKIASVRTDTKDNDYAYPAVGNYIYGSQDICPCHIYIDDVKVYY